MSFAYAVFGLKLSSDDELPELAVTTIDGRPDVAILLDEARPSGLAEGIHRIVGGALLVIDGVGEYEISGGRRILVRPLIDAPKPNVRLFLLGSAMGMLLHQRALVPLHASAVVIGDKSFAFLGSSGAGKSTLAAWFEDRGDPILADDVCVVRFADDDSVAVSSGVRRMRLWREAIEASRRDPMSYERSIVGADDDKYEVPLLGEGETTDVELAAIYVLDRAERFAIEPLHGLDAIAAIFANTYRGEFLAIAGTAAAHLTSCVRLIDRVRVFRVTRSWGFDSLPGGVASLRDHAAQQGGTASRKRADQSLRG